MFDIKDNSSLYFTCSVKSQPNLLIMERMSHGHLQSSFPSGCCIFPLFRVSLFADSLILKRPSRINYVANQFKLQQKLRPAPVSPLRNAAINILLRGERFLFLFTLTRLCCTSTERNHVHPRVQTDCCLVNTVFCELSLVH